MLRSTGSRCVYTEKRRKKRSRTFGFDHISRVSASEPTKTQGKKKRRERERLKREVAGYWSRRKAGRMGGLRQSRRRREDKFQESGGRAKPPAGAVM